MTTFLDTTVSEIERRLRELKDEVSKLEAARKALGGDDPQSSGRSDRSTPATPTRRRRSSASSGEGSPVADSPRRGRRAGARAARALKLVQQRPGITINELARLMKIQPNYLYRVLPKLAADGQVKREGKGWHPTS